MFEFSLAKLIVLIGIILVVWYGFKFVSRIQELREAEAKRRARDERARGRVPPGSAEVEDTVKCRVCGAYVPTRGASDCGQAGCPYGH